MSTRSSRKRGTEEKKSEEKGEEQPQEEEGQQPEEETAEQEKEKAESEQEEENAKKDGEAEKEDKGEEDEDAAEGSSAKQTVRFEEVKKDPPPSRLDPEVIKQQELIDSSEPSSELEKALYAELKRKELQVDRLTSEIGKLQDFVSKRKQAYKRKRKDETAPSRAKSAYNHYVKARFAQLRAENEDALKNKESDKSLRRIPASELIAQAGREWGEVSVEDKEVYEEKAREDRKRYEEEMSSYQPPEKTNSRKRNKTGYNMFFTAHVSRLKQSEIGVPSERGSVARSVGLAWKALSPEEKQYYDKEADKHNGMYPIEREEEPEEEEEEKAPTMQEYPPPNFPMQMIPTTPMLAGYQQHSPTGQHDPRTPQHYQYAHPMHYAPHPAYYAHPPPEQGQQGQQRGYYYPPQHSGQRHPGYDQAGMGI